MKTVKIKSNKSVFKTFLLSYLLVLAVPLILGSISYISAAKIVEKEATNYNMAMLEQAKQSIDTQFQAIDQIINDISLNQRIQKFLYKPEVRNEDDIYEAAMVINEIARYSSVNSLIDQLYVYFKRSNIILNNSGKYPPEIFYEKVTPYAELNYTQWKEILKSYHNRDFLSAQNIMDGSGPKSVLTYMYSLPLTFTKQSLATLVVTLNESKIKKLFANIEPINRGMLYILDRNGQTLVTTSDVALMIPHTDAINIGFKNSFHDEINGQKVIVSYTTSQYNGWKYILIMPTSIFLAKVHYIKALTFWIFIVSLTLGLIIAYILTHKNYTPIKTIAKTLSEKIGAEMVKYRNEYDFMQGTLNDIIENSDRFKNVIDGQAKVLKYYFPMDVESRLIKNVKAGDKSETMKILNGIFERNFGENDGSMKLAQCLFFDLMCTAIKVASDIDAYKLADSLDPAVYLQQCNTLNQIQERVKTIYEKLSDYTVQINRSRRDRETLDKILKYIASHYADNNLSLSTIAEALYR